MSGQRKISRRSQPLYGPAPSSVLPSGWIAIVEVATLILVIAGCTPSTPKAGVSSVRLDPAFSGFTAPVGLYSAGDGSTRLFVVEQRGTIHVRRRDSDEDSVFLDIQDRVASGGELGLLGLAFHPAFEDNGRFFVNYTSRHNGLHTRISEFLAEPASGRVDPERERILLTIAQPYDNHNGGEIAFGPDGYLYIATGDGGSWNDPQGNGQNLTTLLGKFLRIDVDRSNEVRPYAIPPDNPFIGHAEAAPEIWAFGFRNPWRFAFDRPSGRLFAADVGQKAREEIDIVRRGGNYGWNIMEGTICTPGVSRNCRASDFESPYYDYERSEGTVVIGGRVYRGSTIPSLVGAYVFGDFGSGRIWGLRDDGGTVTRQLLIESGRRIVAFGEDDERELYAVEYGGEILKMVPLPAAR